MRREPLKLLAILSVVTVAAIAATPVAAAARQGQTGRPAFAGLSARLSHHAAIHWGKPIYVDNFNETTLDPERWAVYNDPNGKVHRTKSSVRIRGGKLELIGHHERPYGLVSGGVSNRINQTYGRWVIRFRADKGAGYEPIVLLWPHGTWPTDGEIDLAEVFKANRHGAGEFLHLGGRHHVKSHPIPHSVHFNRWHTITVDWLPSHITFWLDGKRLWTRRHLSGTANYIPDTPFHLALQNDEGCDGRCPTSNIPRKWVVMRIDWIKIYAAPAKT